MVKAPGLIRFGAELVHREFVLAVTPGRGGALVCVTCHTHHLSLLSASEGALFYFWEGSALLQSWNFPREWGLIISPFQGCAPITSPLAGPHWGAVGVPSLGLEVRAALAQSHTLSLCFTWTATGELECPHQKDTKDNPPFLPSQSLLPPTHPSTEKVKIILNFKSN